MYKIAFSNFLPWQSLFSLFSALISPVGGNNLYLSMPYLCLRCCVDTKYFHRSMSHKTLGASLNLRAPDFVKTFQLNDVYNRGKRLQSA